MLYVFTLRVKHISLKILKAIHITFFLANSFEYELPTAIKCSSKNNLARLYMIKIKCTKCYKKVNKFKMVY